jgi:hypothetical protein
MVMRLVIKSILKGAFLLFNAKMSYFFPSYIMKRTSYIQWNNYDVWFVLEKHAKLDL